MDYKNNKVIHDYLEKLRDIEINKCSTVIKNIPKIEEDIAKLETLALLREVSLSTALIAESEIKKDELYTKYIKEMKELTKFYNSKKTDVNNYVNEIISLKNAMTHFKEEDDEEFN